MSTIWKMREYNGFEPYMETEIEEYESLGFTRPMAEVLVKRDASYDSIKKVLKTPSFCLTESEKIYGLKAAAEKIAESEGRRFFVFADYDVDGLTAGYIMTSYLRRMAYDVTVYYPERREGYGLSKKFVESYCSDGDVIITVDNGITALEAVDLCNKKNITVIVTDHHMPGKKLPKCCICDPQLGEYGHNLCGAAVVLKICRQLDLIFGTNIWWTYTPYAALGTISDIMPMDEENMVIVRTGLQLMRKYAPNIFEMILASGSSEPSVEVLAWKVIPKLNACGRMDNIDLAKEFMFNSTKDLRQTITEIEEINERRKKITQDALNEAMKQEYALDAFCLFDATQYPVGLSGLIANKLSEIFNKPAIVYCRNNSDCWSGSVRSSRINILSCLKILEKQGVIIGCAGHSHACAVFLYPDVETFKNILNSYLRTTVTTVEKDNVIMIDSVITFYDLTQELLSSVRMIPSDKDLWPEPIFRINNLRVASVRYSRNNTDNVCFSVVDDNRVLMDIWGWGLASTYKSIGSPDMIDIIGTVTNAGYGKNADKVVFNIEGMKKSQS